MEEQLIYGEPIHINSRSNHHHFVYIRTGNFSREIERISGEHFRKSLSNATKLPLVGVLIGAVVTAVIQSSSSTSVIAISLVNAGVLSFKNSVGIIFGSNVGTTITAQRVVFKITSFAPFLIIFICCSITHGYFW